MTNRGTLRGTGGGRADLRIITFDIEDGSAATLSPGAKARYRTVPFDCIIAGWRLMAAPTGSIVLDVWADRAGNFPPTVADTLIGTGAKPTLTSAAFAEDVDPRGWDTDLDAGDVVEINIDSVTTCTRAVFELHIIPRGI